MATERRMKRRAVSAAGIIAALAIAAPVAHASAGPPAVPLSALPAVPALPAFAAAAAPGWFAEPFIAEPFVGGVAVAKGATVIGSVFNGGTTVVVSTSPAVGTTVGSP